MSRKYPNPECACGRDRVTDHSTVCETCSREAAEKEIADKFDFYDLDQCVTLAEVKDWIKKYVIAKE